MALVIVCMFTEKRTTMPLTILSNSPMELFVTITPPVFGVSQQHLMRSKIKSANFVSSHKNALKEAIQRGDL